MPRERSASPPRSSNRTCGFPASGFPTGFVTGSRHDALPSQMSQSRHTKIAEHRFHAERSDASRGHLAAPDQEVAHAVIQMGLDHAIRDVMGSGAEEPHHPRNARFSVPRTSSHGPLLPGTRIAPSLSFRRCTLLFDGLAPMNHRPCCRWQCGPKL